MKKLAQQRTVDGSVALVQIGKNGITPGVVLMVEEALAAHELVKLKVGDGVAADVAEELAGQSNSAVCGVIGNTALLARVRREGKASVIRPLLEAS